MRIAIIGTGISGLTCAYLLHPRHDVTVFEADVRPGGHSHSVRVDLADESVVVDTGFLVYNERTYPGLVRLFDRLGVPTQPSDMSFSVTDDATGIEWRGTSPTTVFAQRRNLLRPRFHRMLVDVARFNRRARRLLEEPAPDSRSVRTFVADGGWSDAFVDWYLIPMASAVWSADPRTVMDWPMATFARFFDNHGFLSFGDQPQWRTVTGGAVTYVEAILRPLGERVRLGCPVRKIARSGHGVEVLSDRFGPERFDHVIVATHSDQALELLADPSTVERDVLGAIDYQPNEAILHTDARLLPRNPLARASWNYHRPVAPSDRATLTYHLNRLQSIRCREELCVTLNRSESIESDRILARYEVAHPVLDTRAVTAQQRYDEISGANRTWYCGAYWGYGFHEDGLQSGLRVSRAFGASL
jgi:predicted NAD/FAD-binding protein